MRRLWIVCVLMLSLALPVTAQAGRSVIVPGNAQLVTDLGQFTVTESLNDAAFSPDSRYLATVGDDTALRIWDVASGEQVAEAFEHFLFVTAVVWFDTALVTGSWDKTAIVWDVTEEGQPSVREVVAGSDAVVDALEALPVADAVSFFMGVGDGKVRLYNPVDKTVMQEWALPSLRVTSVAVSPDVRSLVTAAGYPSKGAQLWAIATENNAPATDIPYSGTVLSVEYLSSSVVALGGDEGSVMLWESGVGQIGSLEQNDWVIDLAVSPDSTLLAVARQDGVLTLWDVTTPEQSELIVAIVASDSAALTSVTFSPDGRLMVTTDEEGTARLWGVEVK